ncbi:MAG: hypothetical protein IPL62_12675 [Caulobacteraceae bacterium]|nr:hypothetical protein [Caulobacteraceae bacterium]
MRDVVVLPIIGDDEVNIAGDEIRCEFIDPAQHCGVLAGQQHVVEIAIPDATPCFRYCGALRFDQTFACEPTCAIGA